MLSVSGGAPITCCSARALREHATKRSKTNARTKPRHFIIPPQLFKANLRWLEATISRQIKKQTHTLDMQPFGCLPSVDGRSLQGAGRCAETVAAGPASRQKRTDPE